MTEPTISVLLADDHSLVRRGFRRMLEDDPRSRLSGKPKMATRRCDSPPNCGHGSWSWISLCRG
jgi:hypothetical protein